MNCRYTTSTSYRSEILHPHIPAVHMIIDPENMSPAKVLLPYGRPQLYTKFIKNVFLNPCKQVCTQW